MTSSDMFSRHYQPGALDRAVKSRLWTNDELTQAYAQGTAPTQRASTGPRAVLTRMASTLISAIPRKRRTSEEREKERRRKRALSSPGEIPGHLAQEFTEGEKSVLVVIARQFMKHGFCDFYVEQIGRLAGVRTTTVQNAIRRAKGLGLLSVLERRRPGRKSETNIVRISCAHWVEWLRVRIGFKRTKAKWIPTENLSLSKPADSVVRAFENEKAATAAQNVSVDRWRNVGGKQKERGRAYG
jgi:hypothetical protein